MCWANDGDKSLFLAASVGPALFAGGFENASRQYFDHSLYLFHREGQPGLSHIGPVQNIYVEIDNELLVWFAPHKQIRSSVQFK